MISLAAAVSFIALTAEAAQPGTCRPIAPFYGLASLRATASLRPDAAGPCALEATIPPSSQPSIPGAFVWYRRPDPAAPLRISFHLYQTSVERGVFDSWTVLTANPVLPHISQNYFIDHVLVVRMDNRSSDGLPQVSVGGVCTNTSPSDPCVGAFTIPTPIDATLRFEVISDPSGGTIRAWLDADFSAPPILELTGLDNAEWGGIASVSLGAFGAVGGYSVNGMDVRISDIQSSDDTIFFSTMDGGPRP